MKYAISKGVFDILPDEPDPENSWRSSAHWQYVETVMRQVAHAYNFQEIRTPIFEKTELFTRSVGETSDIVSKEMYTFQDRAERSISLRPEGTAAVMRAFVEKNLHTRGPVHKFYYIGPMFRYERPQAGRYRQHHQFGAEAIGLASPEQDVELIDMLAELYRRLGLTNLNIVINSVGDPASRQKYTEALRSHLEPHFAELSVDSQARFSKNILRILDSKDPQDQKLLQGAPSILDALNEECREHFQKVRQLLDLLKLPYTVEPKLVRGLDYYNKTVFEIICGQLGAQNTMGAGGRYDGLIQALGGPDLASAGFATGIERILQTLVKEEEEKGVRLFPKKTHPFLFLIPLKENSAEEKSREFCFQLTRELRQHNIPTEISLLHKKVGQALQVASSLGATYALVIGEEELQSGYALIKNMEERREEKVPLNELVSFCRERAHPR